MRRRDFIAAIGGVTAIWPLTSLVRPLTARAQQQAQPQTPPVIGFLGSASQEAFAPFVAGFNKGLKEAGREDGRNVRVEYRWANTQFDRLPALAVELAALKAAVIVTVGGNVAALAAKQATSTVPVVFATADDPVASGLVQSLNRPDGNLTGVTWMGIDV